MFFYPLYSKGWKSLFFVSISTENIKTMKKKEEIM